MDDKRSRNSWLEWLIVGSCAVFIFILALSAAYSIRALHALQALIYFAVVLLARRRSAWGYGAGCVIAALWNWTNIVHTTFIASGLRELARTLQTGRVSRTDQLIAVFASAAHFVLIASCVTAYFRIKPRSSWEPVKFVAGGLFAVGYFVGIIIAVGPQYVPLFEARLRNVTAGVVVSCRDNCSRPAEAAQHRMQPTARRTGGRRG